MQAGKLRHRITIQRPNQSSPLDGAGQPIIAWLDVVTDLAANVEPISGRSEFIAAQTQASTTHDVSIRWSPSVASVDASYRILFGSRFLYLDRDPINVEERNRELTMQCTEGLRDG